MGLYFSELSRQIIAFFVLYAQTITRPDLIKTRLGSDTFIIPSINFFISSVGLYIFTLVAPLELLVGADYSLLQDLAIQGSAILIVISFYPFLIIMQRTLSFSEYIACAGLVGGAALVSVAPFMIVGILDFFIFFDIADHLSAPHYAEYLAARDALARQGIEVSYGCPRPFDPALTVCQHEYYQNFVYGGGVLQRGVALDLPTLQYFGLSIVLFVATPVVWFRIARRALSIPLGRQLLSLLMWVFLFLSPATLIIFYAVGFFDIVGGFA